MSLLSTAFTFPIAQFLRNYLRCTCTNRRRMTHTDSVSGTSRQSAVRSALELSEALIDRAKKGYEPNSAN